MIIVKLIGGLGNQMFQYATAKALAIKFNVPLKVDVNYVNNDSKGNYTQRKYELDAFKINMELAIDAEINELVQGSMNRITRIFQRQFPSFYKRIYFAESGGNYNKKIESCPPNTYLDGFWQSERYFSHIREQLIKDFSIKQEMPNDLDNLLATILSGNSVSIHVRRGDYVSLPSANTYHGVCDFNYYQRAVSLLAENSISMELFVFSDDLDWCRKNMRFEQAVHFIEQNHGDIWDFFLMSRCKNNIIANSSFSWWAAWLNPNPDKAVIAPEFWFKNIKSCSLDILAQNWLTV